MSRRLLEDTISPTVDEENRDIGRLSFLSNVEEENSRNSMNIDANKSTITIRRNMVNEILRILDRSLLFTISFMLIDILKVVCSSLVLFFLDRNWDEIDIEAWICLILFVIQNVFEILYFLSKLVQNLFKQKTVINIFLSGSEINFNPYEAKKNEKIMEYLYYLIMIFYCGLFLFGNVVFWRDQNSDAAHQMTYVFAMILIELLIGYFYAFIFALFLLGLLFCAPLFLVSYIYKKLNQRKNAKKIDNLPIIKYEQVFFQDIECSICIESYGEGDHIIQLSCKHYFHEKCIKPWLAISTMCPFCRSSALT